MQSLTINYSSKQIIGKCMQLDSTTTKGKNPIYVFFFLHVIHEENITP